MSKVISSMLEYFGEILKMLNKKFNAAALGFAGFITAAEASAHESAGISHYASQADHTIVISVTIGLVGFAILAWRQRAKKQS